MKPPGLCLFSSAAPPPPLTIAATPTPINGLPGNGERE